MNSHRSSEDQAARARWFAERADLLIADYRKRHPQADLTPPGPEPEQREEGPPELWGEKSEKDGIAQAIIERLASRS